MLTLTTRKTSDCRKKKKKEKERKRETKVDFNLYSRGSDYSTRPFSTPVLTGLGMRAQALGNSAPEKPKSGFLSLTAHAV